MLKIVNSSSKCEKIGLNLYFMVKKLIPQLIVPSCRGFLLFP